MRREAVAGLVPVNQEIMINPPPPARPVRFRFPEDGWLTLTVSRREIASICEALCRLTEGERRQGVIDLAVALGIEVTL
jgi:hypothetical protein